VVTADRGRYGFNNNTSARVYGNNVISGPAQVHQGDMYQTNYNIYQYPGAGTPSRPQPKSYLSDSAVHIASGITDGLVVAGLNGLMQGSKHPPAESGIGAQFQEIARTTITQPDRTSSDDPWRQHAPSQGSTGSLDPRSAGSSNRLSAPAS